MEPLSLYLHIPFCQHRCAYCDFNTYTTISELQQQYIEALGQEITETAALAYAAGKKRPVHTIFFGGGTPSLLSVDEILHLMDCVQQTYGLTPD